MNISSQQIKDALVGNGYLAEDDFIAAEKVTETERVSLQEYLLAEGLITEDILGQAMAELFDVQYANLRSHQPSQEQVLKIPEGVAIKYNIVLFTEDEKHITVTTDNPKQTALNTKLKNIFKGKKIKFAYSLPEEIETVFVHYRKKLETRFSSIIKGQKKIAPEILKEILEDAVIYETSDIHFEPQEEQVVIKFRVDGLLHEAGRIPKEYYENVLNRIKVQAHLRIDEHFTMQDGAMRCETKNHEIDVRVSIVPTIKGEKVTMRLLGSYVRSLALGDVGLLEQDQKLLTAAAQKPFGMILVTGPTGSGKTTSLYALLKLLNRPEVNVTTIEDPVEYRMPDINQIQVNPEANITFAKGLRSIVRQDPDIILVGEIRDHETAEIAVNASLTGHLVLSTFHANDAPTAIPRLLDMGIEPFLLASTLEIIVAQRLVRKICVGCRHSVTMSSKEIDAIVPKASQYFSKKGATLYQSKGCSGCNDTGYTGRVGIFELIPITPEIKSLILQNPSSAQIWDLAKKHGARSLFTDGLEKVKSGVTTLEELFRVASPV